MQNELAKTEDSVEQVSPQMDAYLRAEAIVASINANLPKGAQPLVPIPKDYIFKKIDASAVNHSLHAAYALTGGVAGLVRFAQNHPKEFYAMWSKAATDANANPAATTIIYNSNIPSSPLSLTTVSSNGVVRTAADEDIDFDLDD
jgi:hypothetical protein